MIMILGKLTHLQATQRYETRIEETTAPISRYSKKGSQRAPPLAEPLTDMRKLGWPGPPPAAAQAVPWHAVATAGAATTRETPAPRKLGYIGDRKMTDDVHGRRHGGSLREEVRRS